MYHLDVIRQKKNIKVVDLCDGICSDRQYRKYLSGTNNISDSRIIQFCNKMGVSSRDFYYTLNISDLNDFIHIKEIYWSLVNKNYKNTQSLISKSKIKTEHLSNQNQRLYNYCLIRNEYSTNNISDNDTINRIAKLIDFKAKELIKVFDFVDILLLLLVAEIEVKSQKTDTLYVLTALLKTNQVLYLSPDSRELISPIYSNVCIMLGRLSKYEDILDINKAGIEFCLKYSFSKSLTRLYYTRAIALKKLDRSEESEEYAVKCLFNSLSLNNNEDYFKFSQCIMKDFDKTNLTIINNYLCKINEILIK